MTLRYHVINLIAKHGGIRKAARALGVDHAYLSRLASGDKENPSQDALRKLGLKRIVTVRYVERK